MTRLHQLPGTFVCKFYSSFVLRSVSLPHPPPTLFRPKPLTIKHPPLTTVHRKQICFFKLQLLFYGEGILVRFPVGPRDFFFLLLEASRSYLGFTQHLFDGHQQLFSPGIKCPACEADHSTPTSAAFKNQCSYYIQSYTHNFVVAQR